MKGKKASEKAGETDSQRCGLGVDFQRSIQKGENKSTVVCVCVYHAHTYTQTCMFLGNTSFFSADNIFPMFWGLKCSFFGKMSVAEDD